MKSIRIELKWAVIFAVMTLAWMWLERIVGLHSTHLNKHAIYTNLVVIPAILVYVLALRDKRQNYFGGNMTYKQGVSTGFIMTTIITAATPITQYIILVYITPEFFPNIIAYAIAHKLTSKEQAEAYFNLKNYIQQSLIGTLMMGIVTTLIAAFFAKRK